MKTAVDLQNEIRSVSSIKDQAGRLVRTIAQTGFCRIITEHHGDEARITIDTQSA